MMELHRAVIHRDGTRLVLVVLDYNNNNVINDDDDYHRLVFSVFIIFIINRCAHPYYAQRDIEVYF